MEGETLYVTTKEIRQKYLPISIKKIREIAKNHCEVKRNGSTLLVNRQQFLDYLSNPDNDILK